MADSISTEKRSWNMSHIKGKDSSIEVKVRKHLFRLGFRYRKNAKDLPGKPDIVLPKYKTVIFINGCFWHRHVGCKNTTTPKTNIEFWESKFRKNVENDQKSYAALRESGWNVIVLWECDIEKCFDSTMDKLVTDLRKRLDQIS